MTCREKCRKCDRTKPTCVRCSSKGLVCKGYPEKFRFCGLATRGKWKNQTAPTLASAAPQKSQLQQTETPHAPTFVPFQHNALVDDQQPLLDITPSDHAMSQASSPCLSVVWQPPDHKSVELDDVLMLDRTEVLLRHCTYRKKYQNPTGEEPLTLKH